MPTIPSGAVGRRRIVSCVLIALLALPSLAPTGVLAQDTVAVGETAVIAATNGAGVLLRASPGYDAAVVGPLAEGTPVDVLDGPTAAADGSLWFSVAAAGLAGWVDAQFLAVPGAAPPAPGPDPAP